MLKAWGSTQKNATPLSLWRLSLERKGHLAPPPHPRDVVTTPPPHAATEKSSPGVCVAGEVPSDDVEWLCPKCKPRPAAPRAVSYDAALLRSRTGSDRDRLDH